MWHSTIWYLLRTCDKAGEKVRVMVAVARDGIPFSLCISEKRSCGSNPRAVYCRTFLREKSSTLSNNKPRGRPPFSPPGQQGSHVFTMRPQLFYGYCCCFLFQESENHGVPVEIYFQNYAKINKRSLYLYD